MYEEFHRMWIDDDNREGKKHRHTDILSEMRTERFICAPDFDDWKEPLFNDFHTIFDKFAHKIIITIPFRFDVPEKCVSLHRLLYLREGERENANSFSANECGNFYNYIDYISMVVVRRRWMAAFEQTVEWVETVMAVIEADTKSSVIIIIHIGLIGVQIRFEEWSLWFCQNECVLGPQPFRLATTAAATYLPHAINSSTKTTILIYRRLKRRERKINESNPYRIHCYGFRM